MKKFRRIIWPTMLRLAWPSYTNEAIFMVHTQRLFFSPDFRHGGRKVTRSITPAILPTRRSIPLCPIRLSVFFILRLAIIGIFGSSTAGLTVICPQTRRHGCGSDSILSDRRHDGTDHHTHPQRYPGHIRCPAILSVWPIAQAKSFMQAGLHADEQPGMLILHHLCRCWRLQKTKQAQRQGCDHAHDQPLGMAHLQFHAHRGRYHPVLGLNYNRGWVDLDAELFCMPVI